MYTKSSKVAKKKTEFLVKICSFNIFQNAVKGSSQFKNKKLFSIAQLFLNFQNRKNSFFFFWLLKCFSRPDFILKTVDSKYFN